MVVGIDDYELLNRYFLKFFEYRSGVEVFGNFKRKVCDDLIKLISMDKKSMV
jgi:hypothetical protein